MVKGTAKGYGLFCRGAALDGGGAVIDLYRMKATTMTLSSKRQSVFPQDWCERVGLAKGGPVNAFDLGEAGLLIRPLKPPTRKELESALAAARPRPSKPGETERIVAEALRKVREAT
jgi:bifunctional DNA-binding transcriptional regulator/antitoxin component of YhaV-PrlF toxin-antitoxin module